MTTASRKTLTLWQRAILFTLYKAEEDWREDLGDDSDDLELVVSRRGFEMALWFDWQTYHTKAVTELQALGWTYRRDMPAGVIGYALTAAGRSSLSMNALGLRHHSKMQWIEKAPF